MSALPLTAPRGLRDLLPEATEQLQHIRRRISAQFARFGYERVTTPAFEYADVLERGLEVDRGEVVRFVEPDSGEVALLRPDMTPQVARIAATRLSHLPAPYRLSYDGTVIRRRSGRARRSRMSAHAGVECIGREGIAGDLEILRLACETLAELGLQRWHLELNQVSIPSAVLMRVPEAKRARAVDALHRKDAFDLDVLGKELPDELARDLQALSALYGGAALDEARAQLDEARYPELAGAFEEIRTVVEALREWFDAHEGASLGVDFGALRGHGYYTGLSFNLLAPGPGVSLGGGGRYDNLLGRFGMPMAATGFGLDLDHLQWALLEAGVPLAPPKAPRILWTGDAQTLEAIRTAGFDVAPFEGDEGLALAYAKGWRFDAIAGSSLVRVSDGASHALPSDWRTVREWITGANNT